MRFFAVSLPPLLADARAAAVWPRLCTATRQFAANQGRRASALATMSNGAERAAAARPFVLDGCDGGARAGVFTAPSKPSASLRTPNCLMMTKQGHPPHLIGSMLHDLEHFQGVAYNMGGLWSHPSPKGIKEYGLGLGTFTNLEEKLLVCTVPDPLRPQEDKHNEAEVVTVTTHAGRRGITAGDYMDTMQAAQPDVIVSIADFQSHRAGRKRQQKSVSRSHKMLEQSIQTLDAWELRSGAAAPPLLLASVVGGNQLDMRTSSAKMAMEANGEVAGFVIEGLDLGETIEDRRKVLAAVIVREAESEQQQSHQPVLPEDRPRVSLALSTPEDVLDAIGQGLDIFGSKFPLELAERGHAITFSFGAMKGDAFSCRDINLHDDSYKRDFSPILPDCTCYTCKRHSKAYLNHLLFTQEMLAEVLLVHDAPPPIRSHNYHQFYLWFEVVRQSIMAGTFEADRAAFLEAYPPPAAEDVEREVNERKRKADEDREASKRLAPSL